MLERLNSVNDVPVYDINSDKYKTYGRILKGYDFTDVIKYMKDNTLIPEQGNIYHASEAELEKYPVKKQLEASFYGGMPLQMGYCNGRNSTYNGFEYHKGSEINVAVSDFMLVLSHTWLIKDNTITAEDAEVFYVPEGTVFEMYQSTLHLSPCKVRDEGFKCVVILPRGTNTPLSPEEKTIRDSSEDPECRLLLQRNKWVLSHPDRKPLMDQGAHPGFISENKELYY